MASEYPIDYYSLLDACASPGCPLCRLLLNGVERLLDSLLYERVNEAETQRAVRARRGLCNTHAWQMSRMTGNALGIAILYRAALDETLSAVKPLPPSRLGHVPGAPSQQERLRLADTLEPTEPCLACRLADDTERRTLGTLTRYLGDERLLAALRASYGLCLNHFRAALRQERRSAGMDVLIDIQRDIWGRLSAQLQEFIDKNDYRRMREPMGAESDSWQRALRALAGEAGAFGIDRSMG